MTVLLSTVGPCSLSSYFGSTGMHKNAEIKYYYSHPSNLSCSSADLAGFAQSQVLLGFQDGFPPLVFFPEESHRSPEDASSPDSGFQAVPGCFYSSISTWVRVAFVFELLDPSSAAAGAPMSVPVEHGVGCWVWAQGVACVEAVLPGAPLLLPFPHQCP